MGSVSSRGTPAVIAILGGLALGVVLFVPYVARQYRRRGEVGPGHAALSLAAVIYGLALIGYVVLPLPAITPGFCAHGGAGRQLHSLQVLDDIRAGGGVGGVYELLHNAAALQLVFNVLLFVPLGMFARHLFRRGVVATTLIGFIVSALIECTQLTGDWFLYPCAYRIFDVDDLLANSLGALIGAIIGPLLRLVPGQPAELIRAGTPRPVTAGRRLLGMVCDLLLLYVIGFGLSAGYVLAGYAFARTPPADRSGFASVLTLLGFWLPVLVLFVLIPLVGGGASLGQRIVRLAPRTRAGTRPSPLHGLARSLFGTGGYGVLVALANTSDIGLVSKVAGAVSWLLVLVAGLAVFTTKQRRGLSAALTRLHFVDARSLLDASDTTSTEHETERSHHD